jgi:hypothetical protein
MMEMRVLSLVLALALQLPAATTTWICPMHPDVRTTEEGKCPRCGMALVTLRPDTSAPFLLDLTKGPTAPDGTLSLSFVVRHPVTHAVVSDLVTVHERPAHMFVVSSDLRVFEHVHPEPQPDGQLRLDWKPPAAGRYHLFLDIVPAGALPQLLEAVVSVGGSKLAAGGEEPRMTAVRDGVQATLEAGQVVAGEWARLVVKLTDATTSSELTGWEPWLGAWGHLFVIRDGATEPRHGHPDEHDAIREAGVTTVGFDVMFPRSGKYGVWLQIQRNGAVITLPFRVEVLSATAR